MFGNRTARPLASRAVMKKICALCALVFALRLNACEQHKAEDLPEEFRHRGEHPPKGAAIAPELTAIHPA
jgi:hypothetical protein